MRFEVTNEAQHNLALVWRHQGIQAGKVEAAAPTHIAHEEQGPVSTSNSKSCSVFEFLCFLLMAPFIVSVTGFTSIYLVYSLPLRIPSDFLPLIQFNDLQECYLQKRRQAADKPHGQQERDTNFISREGYSGGLDDFQSVLTTFTRYRYYYLSLCYLKYQFIYCWD